MADDNNIILFDIEEGITGEKYCTLEYSQETSPFLIFSLIILPSVANEFIC